MEADPYGGLAEAASRATAAWLAEQAWDAGLAAGRAAGPGARDQAAFLRTADGRTGMAYGLGLPGAGDYPLVRNAADAYCDAFEIAAAHREDTVLPGDQYLAGHDVVTASGKAGVLTGEAGAFGHPRVRFADGTTAAVPRSAIMGMVVHVQNSGPPEPGSLLADGDVLLRPPHGEAAVMFAGSLVPATSRLARQMTEIPGGRYRESLLAARLLGGGRNALAAAAVLLDRGNGPRAVILLRPPAGLAAARQGRDEVSLLTRLLAPRGMHVLLPGQEAPQAGPGWTLQFPAPGLVSVTGPGIVLHKGVLPLPAGWEAAARASGAEVIAGDTGLPGPGGPDTAAAITDAAQAGRLVGGRIQVAGDPALGRAPPARVLGASPDSRRRFTARRPGGHRKQR